MKASVSPRTIALLLGGLWLAGSTLRAQDAVTQTDGTRREGEIVAVSNGQVQLKIGPAQIGIPLANVASVEKDAPPPFAQAEQAWQQGQGAPAIAALKPLVAAFGGLPIDWVRQSYRLLGDIYLAQHQLDQAAQIFAAYQKQYPDFPQIAVVGQAAIAVEKKDYSAAQAALAPILAEAAKVLLASAEQDAVYAHASYLMGQIEEAAGHKPEALQDYLTAATLYHSDQAITLQAQQHADALNREKQIIVP